MSSNQQQQQRKGQEFLCKVRLKNPLPEIPFGPKLLSHPVDESKYALYNPQNEWLKSVPFPVLSGDNDIGMPVDLVDMAATLRLANSAPVPAEDDILLKAPSKASTETAGRYRPVVPWLRRTEYISNVDSRNLDRQRSKEADADELLQRHVAENGTIDFSRQGQIGIIEKSFQSACQWDKDIEKRMHPHKPGGVHAVESWPVLPGSGEAGQTLGTYSQCTFDHIPDNMTGSDADVILKVYQGEENAGADASYQYIVLFTRQEERAYKRTKLYDFQMSRYVDQEKLAFVFSSKESAILFYEISARFALRKKRDSAGAGRDIPGRIILTENSTDMNVDEQTQ